MSTPDITIYSWPENNPLVWKSQIVAKLNGVNIVVKTDIKMDETNKTEAFLNVNPFGQVPTAFLGTTQDRGVFESTSIARYIARLGESKYSLYGKDILTTSRIDAFLDAIQSFDSNVMPWAGAATGCMKDVSEVEVTKSKTTTIKNLSIFESILSKQSYLVGNDMTLADIVLWCPLTWCLINLFDAPFRSQYPSIMKWFQTLATMNEFSEVSGEIKLL